MHATSKDLLVAADRAVVTGWHRPRCSVVLYVDVDLLLPTTCGACVTSTSHVACVTGSEAGQLSKVAVQGVCSSDNSNIRAHCDGCPDNAQGVAISAIC